MVTQSTSYTLRAGAPQPRSECSLSPGQTNLQIQRVTGYVLQTFMAEKTVTETCEDQDQLLCSNDMVGLGGNFLSASYTAQRFLDSETGGIVFTATETRDKEYIQEDQVPGVSNL